MCEKCDSVKVAAMLDETLTRLNATTEMLVTVTKALENETRARKLAEYQFNEARIQRDQYHTLCRINHILPQS